jgi:hypothetical protein
MKPLASREGARRRRLRWEASHPEEFRRAARRGSIKSVYGLTLEEHDAILASQDGVCAICRGPALGRKGRWFDVDHDHVTGKIRGLLCMDCNRGIGALKDDPALCRAAADYLEARK